jgi:5-methylcytosine-specific restriction endonuclease McrA
MMKLRMQRPLITAANLSIVKVPEKTADPFYSSAEWRVLRLACLKRDRFRCQAPGCTNKANVADHIVSRHNGGKNELSNLRSLCSAHDAQVKEDALGRRRNDGKLTAL